MSGTNVTISHNPTEKRFEAKVGSEVAVSEYMRVGDSFIFTHTEVPESLEGQGVGSALVKWALDYLRDNGFTAAPLCPFVKGYIQRHPEYADLVRLG